MITSWLDRDAIDRRVLVVTGSGKDEAKIARYCPLDLSSHIVTIYLRFVRKSWLESPREREGSTVVLSGDGRGQGLRWVKSSLSYSSDACVEVADLPDGRVGVRHGKDSSGPLLQFTGAEWRAFLAGARTGEFDGFGGRRPDQGRQYSGLAWAEWPLPGQAG